MASSSDVADVPALLEAMFSWLDPADDVGESAVLRRWPPQDVVPPAACGLGRGGWGPRRCGGTGRNI